MDNFLINVEVLWIFALEFAVNLIVCQCICFIGENNAVDILRKGSASKWVLCSCDESNFQNGRSS